MGESGNQIFRVLVVDDDPATALAMKELVAGLGYTTEAAHTAEEALELFKRQTYHLLITDLVLPGRSGLDLLRAVHEAAPATAIVLLTGHASLRTAVLALKCGADDYLSKPVDPRRLKNLIARLLHGQPSFISNQLLEAEGRSVVELDGMIAESRAMKAVFEKIALAAVHDHPVLLRGESGTGRELCASSIHRRSRRAPGPFVPVRLSTIPPERLATEVTQLLEQARGGTLYLDEVRQLEAAGQSELLRSIGPAQAHGAEGASEGAIPTPAGARVIASSTHDLAALVAQGAFREDLFYRLNIFCIELPALRQRREDLPHLVDDFVRQFCARYGKPRLTLPDDTLTLLSNHSWPGNVRELKSVVEQAVLLCQSETLSPDLLPMMLHGHGLDGDVICISVGTSIKEIEREVIVRTLEKNGGNKNRTAKTLGISRRSLYNKLERYRITKPPPTGSQGEA